MQREREKRPHKPETKEFNDKVGLHEINFTHGQKQVGNLIKQNDIVFVVGPAGTGKSLGILGEFVRQYLVDRTKQIVVIRTPAEASDDKIGFLPDDLNRKLEPHFASAKQALDMLLNKNKVEADMGKRIHFKVPNYVLGSTFDNSLILIDESQQISPKILKLLLERIGKNSVCVVAGDETQLYASDKRRNGLTDALSRFLKEDRTEKYSNVAYYEFDVEDVQRSEIVKTVIRAYKDLA